MGGDLFSGYGNISFMNNFCSASASCTPDQRSMRNTAVAPTTPQRGSQMSEVKYTFPERNCHQVIGKNTMRPGRPLELGESLEPSGGRLQKSDLRKQPAGICDRTKSRPQAIEKPSDPVCVSLPTKMGLRLPRIPSVRSRPDTVLRGLEVRSRSSESGRAN